jgi:putative toxin-antitoxin system antitoxin component (TIGR02293 family)
MLWHNVYGHYMGTNILNMAEFLGIAPRSEFDLTRIIENGLPPESLALLKKHGLSFTEISEIVISPRTLKHRRARSENLSHEETDRMVRVARIVALADDVFGDHSKALLWLRTEDDRIGGRRPLSMLRTDAGGRLIENMLWQIDEGIYS